MERVRKILAAFLSLCLTVAAVPMTFGHAAEDADHNGDAYTRSLSIITDMVHDNPGEAAYVTQYDDCSFLSLRGYNGKVFFLSEAAQLAIDWQDYDPNVFPVGSAGYNWVQNKKTELHEKYGEAKEEGLKVYFMMDFISLPSSMKTLYGDEIMTNGKIDINKEKTQEIMKEMMREIFTEFPEVDGFYLRYGESYVGYYSSYHFGNNPIAVSGTKADDHTTLLQFFREEVCAKYGKEVIYRTWSTETGNDSFTTSKDLYLRITDAVEPHENLYIAIKHTAGDFWRNYTFNQTIGIGRHQQIIEVQCAREYEGKGAYPNYIAGGVINGFPEYEWQMSAEENQSLRNAVNCEDSLVVGMWTWSRGGGWGGPYTNGTQNPEGDELWSDLNAYVLTQWAQDTSRTDTSLVKQYAKEILGMNNTDAANFVRFAELSSEAVLYGIGTNCSPSLTVLWTRDASVNPEYFSWNVDTMYNHREADGYCEKLEERRRAVTIYNEMLAISESFSDDVEKIDFIRTTTKYGYYFFSICDKMYTAALMNIDYHNYDTYTADEVNAVIDEAYALLDEWKQLEMDSPCCPTLYNESNFLSILQKYTVSEEEWVDTRIDGPDKNLALNCESSSLYGGVNYSDFAFDGDSSTYWSTIASAEDSASDWIQIDFGEKTKFDRVVLQWHNGYAKDYKLQISDDGVNFTDILSITGGSGGKEDHVFEPVTARYLRMQGITEGNSKNHYSLKEFEVYNTKAVPNVIETISDNMALNKSVTASRQHNAFAPTYINDGDNDNTNKDTTKRWNAGNIANAECWIYVDLGESKTFNRLMLYWNLRNCPKGYEIQVSDNATDWSTVYTYSGGLINSDDTAKYIQEVNFDAATGRYVRIYVSADNRVSDTNNWVSLVEMEIYSVNRYERFAGDVTTDGAVGASDLTMLARHIGGIETLTDEYALLNADVEADGEIVAGDLTTLSRIIGKIE